MNGYISLERAGNDALALMPDDVRHIAALARLFGWDDQEADREWRSTGDGVEDDAGSLSDSQASGLRVALQRALDDLPNHDAMRHKLKPCSWAGPRAAEQGWLEEDEQQRLTVLERFSGDGKQLVRDLVAFLRRGAFRVVREQF